MHDGIYIWGKRQKFLSFKIAFLHFHGTNICARRVGLLDFAKYPSVDHTLIGFMLYTCGCPCVVHLAVDWAKDDTAVNRKDMYIQHGTNCHLRNTTKGWKQCIEWKDGTTMWEGLANHKESNSIEVARYAIAKGIQDKPVIPTMVGAVYNPAMQLYYCCCE